MTQLTEGQKTRAVLLMKKPGKLNEAVAEFHKAIELDPKDALAHLNLGSNRSRVGLDRSRVNG